MACKQLSSSGVRFVKAAKQLVLMGMLAIAGATGARGGEFTAALTIDQIREIIDLFQEQKAQFLALQKDQQKSYAKKIRDEVRSQMAWNRPAVLRALRQELRESVAEAKAQAAEHRRKLAQETAEAAREASRGR